jgi:predicted nucleotidyltransferase
VKDPLSKIKNILAKNKCVVFGYLFGSRAKGYADIKSDWDIAVYLRSECLKDWSRFYIEAEIERETGERVQVTVLNTIEDPVFVFEIINSGMLIVNKDNDNRILFESSALKRSHDWNYFLDRYRKSSTSE